MLNHLKRLSNSEAKKRLLSNFFSLSILQLLTYLIPLLTIPYLVRVLGVANFGLISFVAAVVSYFQIVVDFGFNYTATREISIHRDNNEMLNEIFSSVMTIKFILSVVCAILMCILLLFVVKFSKDWDIFLLTFGVIIGQMLFPVWFFQGLERMKYITYLNILSKSIFTITIFVFVKNSNDYFWVPLLNSLGMIIVGVWSLLIIRNEFGISYRIQTLSKLMFYFRDGWNIFISNLAVSLYSATTLVLLGLFTNNIVVGYYSIADKLILAIKGMISPISQALFPYISRLALNSKDQVLDLLKKMIFVFGTVMLIISLFIFVFADIVVVKLFGINASDSIIILRILSIIPFLVSLDTILGVLNMLVFKRNKEYRNIILCSGILNLLIALLLIPTYKHIGAAISVLFVELLITISLFVYTQRNDLKIFGRHN